MARIRKHLGTIAVAMVTAAVTAAAPAIAHGVEHALFAHKAGNAEKLQGYTSETIVGEGSSFDPNRGYSFANGLNQIREVKIKVTKRSKIFFTAGLQVRMTQGNSIAELYVQLLKGDEVIGTGPAAGTAFFEDGYEHLHTAGYLETPPATGKPLAVAPGEYTLRLYLNAQGGGFHGNAALSYTLFPG